MMKKVACGNEDRDKNVVVENAVYIENGNITF
jgi:hypothetical protein